MTILYFFGISMNIIPPMVRKTPFRASARILRLLLVLCVAFVHIPMLPQNANAQFNAALTAFPTFSSGAVLAIAVSGTTIYVGGDFNQATNASINGGNTVVRNRFAAIDATTGALLPFNPQFNNTVRFLIVNGGFGRFYAGGDFTMVNGNMRNLVCSFDVGTNVLNAWNPISGFTGSYVRSFALDGNNVNVCAWGQFTNIIGSTRKYGCFFDGMGVGSADVTFFPQFTREDLDTNEIELQSYARVQEKSDLFVQVGVRVLDNNAPLGNSVRIEMYLRSTRSLDSIFKAAQPTIRGRLRFNNQALMLDRSEFTVRRLSSATPSADGLQTYIVPPLFWNGRSETLAIIKCVAVAGST